MRTPPPRSATRLGCAWLLMCAGCAGPDRGRAAAVATTALLGGTIYASPTAEPIHNGVVVIRDGVIAAVGDRRSLHVPPDAKVLDCSGGTITAGFWNSHVHFFRLEWSAAATLAAPKLADKLRDVTTRYGFTSVFDTGSMWSNTRALRDRVESGEVPGPTIRSTGEALVAPGAMPSSQQLNALGIMSFPAPEIASDAQALAAARQLLERGVDGIKVHLQRPPPPLPPIAESALRTVVTVTHGHGKLVFVHPTNAADVLAAVRSGVDVVLHTTPASGPWDDATVTAMLARHVALTPTLTLWQSHDHFAATAAGQLRAFAARGGRVLFGTDLGAVGADPSSEYALMAGAGMDFREILASLTTAPAEQFGEAAQRGTIAPGLRADLVVLGGDPAADLRALSNVRTTLRDGKVVFSRRH